MASPRLFKTEQPAHRPLSWADGFVLLAVAVLIYIGVRLAVGAPEVIERPGISLAPRSLPLYAAFSVGRMAAAYALSLLFTLVYGYVAAYNRRAEQVLMPLLDVLQSVPILSFLPVVVLSLSAILPEGIAVELGSIVLIFTSQVWNMTFGWYQSLVTIPKELREASAVFRFNGWLRLNGAKPLPSPVGRLLGSPSCWPITWQPSTFCLATCPTISSLPLKAISLCSIPTPPDMVGLSTAPPVTMLNSRETPVEPCWPTRRALVGTSML